MKNPRITAKERGLLKGAIRRVFSRSDLRRAVIASARIVHFDPARPRVKKWCRCTECKQPVAEYQMEVDHFHPLVPIEKTLEDMSWDELIDRAWCEEKGLLPKCKPCHKSKTKEENKKRREARKAKNP